MITGPEVARIAPSKFQFSAEPGLSPIQECYYCQCTP
jgi:hypothetical protein